MGLRNLGIEVEQDLSSTLPPFTTTPVLLQQGSASVLNLIPRLQFVVAESSEFSLSRASSAPQFL